ncbi:tRNA (adenosine(37)-N6)-threonylcarbamoyltransferase complex dimerization subunit type 1 TsaB [Myxococcota bacterium]|nr:tRNA (adenosine(37)-N6)-threonylcarbamoyltransferase complex dimerization subunit type 1 TsaB [Myxococcota bacterium]
MSDESNWLLAIESATRQTSVALFRGADLIDEEWGPLERDVAESLLESIDVLLARCKLSPEEIQDFAVSIGPGSFTSLRIGVATVKGLAFGRPHRAVGISTLEALALEVEPGRLAVPVLDARRGELYAAVYQREPGGSGVDLFQRLPEGVYTPEEVAGALDEPCVLVGDGGELAGNRISELASASVAVLTSPRGSPRARQVGRIARNRLTRGEFLDAGSLVPRYLRRPEAEVKRTGVRFEGS